MLSALDKKNRRRERNHKRYNKNSSCGLKLVINRSNKHFYAQIVDMQKLGKVIFSSSTLSKDFVRDNSYLNKVRVEKFAKFFVENLPNDYRGKKVVFDKSESTYCDTVSTFADIVRECLDF
ncbi:50S ribosomal protein L18 [Anaplasmataceae bacterium AB001_6]|nr:50S ribosomal protein L18 [Anaplasmataceae bacterium AB001_6]